MRSSREGRLIRRVVSDTYARIYDVIRRIPRGRVMTYGDVAALAGMPRGARVVGYALRTSGGRVPWQRVVGRKGPTLAQVTIKDPIGGAEQRVLLEKEGVRFDANDAIDLERYGAGPPRAEKKNGRPGRPGRPRRRAK